MLTHKVIAVAVMVSCLGVPAVRSQDAAKPQDTAGVRHSATNPEGAKRDAGAFDQRTHRA